jgi:hypothetical protein
MHVGRTVRPAGPQPEAVDGAAHDRVMRHSAGAGLYDPLLVVELRVAELLHIAPVLNQSGIAIEIRIEVRVRIDGAHIVGHPLDRVKSMCSTSQAAT